MAHAAQMLTQEPIYKLPSIFCFKPILLSAHKLILLIYSDNNVSLYAGKPFEAHSTPSRSGIGQVARPAFSIISGRVTGLRAVDEGAVPASAPATSWLFVLPVAARRWVSTDNRRSPRCR